MYTPRLLQPPFSCKHIRHRQTLQTIPLAMYFLTMDEVDGTFRKTSARTLLIEYTVNPSAQPIGFFEGQFSLHLRSCFRHPFGACRIHLFSPLGGSEIPWVEIGIFWLEIRKIPKKVPLEILESLCFFKVIY